ncbi:MAG: hypothetical protein E7341_04705 [Clostridiales bacterium]|nr:hypothetical protein [Clostridiales bacterium]
MEGELNRIKKLYGENFAKLCRSLFPTILQEEGKLLGILQAKFAPTRTLWEDLLDQQKVQEFKYYIYNAAGIKQAQIVDTKEKPEKLMAKAGYKLYRCKTSRDIAHFKKYYTYEEQLCTFTDNSRIHTHHVFFAVKKGAEKLKRSDFEHPRREDEYGTSVISIQFDKRDSDISIKNRYNHTVDNPDSTFYNDLENIIPGLTSSFAKYYGLTPVIDYSRYNYFDLDGYVTADDGRRYRINQNTNDFAFCENNIVIDDGDITQYDKARYELVDCYLIDRSKKTIKSLINGDSFADGFKNIERIDVEKTDEGGKQITITFDGGKEAYIVTNKNNAIVSYENEHITKIDNDFMRRNKQLKSLKLPNVEEVGDYFCYHAKTLDEIEMPKVKSIGSCFLSKNEKLEVLAFANLEKVGDTFLFENKNIEKVYFPKLKIIGDKFLSNNKAMMRVDLPSAEVIGNDFLYYNNQIAVANIPNVVEIKSEFMSFNQTIREISLPKLKYIGGGFLRCASNIRGVHLPEVEQVGSRFLHDARNLEVLIFPKVSAIGNGCLVDCKKIKELELLNLRSVGDNFLLTNEDLEKFVAPKLSYIGENFLAKNRRLKQISFPHLEWIDKGFLRDNTELTYAELPKLRDGRYLSSHMEEILSKTSEKESE